MGTEGFRLSPSRLREGQDYEVVSPTGHRFTGVVQLNLPGQTMLGTVRELGDGLFRLLTWTDPAGRTGVWASLATYDGDPAVVRSFAERAQPVLATAVHFGGVKKCG